MHSNNYTPPSSETPNKEGSKFIYKTYSDGRHKFMTPQKYRILAVLVNGILAGIIFSLGAVTYLEVDSRYLGSALFSIGMLVILTYGFGFYTSRIGYCFTQNKEQNLMLIPLWLGNILGAMFTGYIFSLTRDGLAKNIYQRANELCGPKLADSSGGILIMSIFCGILMFIITDNYKNAKNAAQKYIILFVCTMVFVLCDFDHFTSSAFYFVAAKALNFKAIWYILIMSVGNSLGALAIPYGHKLIKLIQNQAKKR